MAGKVLTLEDILSPDDLAVNHTEKYIEWKGMRTLKEQQWEEIHRYVFQTDTTQTSNSSLPWKNKTTTPKLCQIADNLIANYMATEFPRRKNVEWEADTQDANSMAKREAISSYMQWSMEQPYFKQEMRKIISDFVYYGNAFGTVEWMDLRTEQADKTQSGYVGPAVRRISPLDIVMNPTAPNFIQSPKFIRSVITLGELKKYLEGLSNDENQASYQKLYDYLKNIRFMARSYDGDWSIQDRLYQMDGFSSFRQYLQSDAVEVLTFYGDWYDPYNDKLEENRVVTIVDRHKLINNVPNPSYFGYAPIFHVTWRMKQDNLWGMGPLDNLIGLQYRLDHIENMKADIFDLVTYPVQKVKGFVDDFTWQPGEKIFVTEEGDVDLIVPDVNALQANMELNLLEEKMEVYAGAPKEAMGFRSPGEKTKYEVQRLENASSRIYQSKINQFEEQMLEPILNAMLELARRNMSAATTIRVFNDDYKFATFQTLSPQDITGVGRIRPIGARHFAEQAELIQNLTNLTGSGLWATVQPHFSGIKLAQIVEEIFDLKDYKVVTPYIALAEQADAQRQIQVMQEQLQQETMTATGMGEDFDIEGTQAQGMQMPVDPEMLQQ